MEDWKDWLLLFSPLLLALVVVVVLVLAKKVFFARKLKRTDSSCPNLDQKWDRRVGAGCCGKCNQPFTQNNPHYGGGMCRDCWARNEC